MKTVCEDTYFLDRDLAYQTALAHNTITLQNGLRMEQVCYYDGQPFQLAPDNLIHLPAENISEYFTNQGDRIPTHIETTIARESDTIQLQQRLKAVMNAVQNLQKIVIKKV